MDRAPSSDPEGLTFEEAEDLLLHSPVLEVVGLLPNSTNYTYLARLSRPGRTGEMLAVYKPEQGESPLWDFPAGSLHRREVAAYRLSRALGWPLVPPTVTRRKGPLGIGSLQLFVEAESGRAFFNAASLDAAELVPVALFDVIANNADRKAGHHLRDSRGRVWVIDHGLTFHVDQKLRTILWDFAGEPLPKELRADVERVLGDFESGRLAAMFEDLIDDRERRVLERRLAGVLDRRWRFPSPSSAWSIPWPPV